MTTSDDKVRCEKCGAVAANRKLRLCNKHYIEYRRGDPKPCTQCGRVTKARRKNDPVCADCEVKEFAARYMVDQKERFSRIPVEPVERTLKGYLGHLCKWYGDKPKPIWEAFYPVDDLLSHGEIQLASTWDNLEAYRKNYAGPKSVRYKAALYAYMEYLSAVGVIEPREDKQYDQMYQRQVEAVRPSYRKAFRGYIKFCLDVRMLSRVTVLNEGVQIRDFLVWFEDVSGGQHLGAVHTGIVREYLTSALDGYSQKSVYLIHKAIRDFFRWARMQRVVFTNPVLGAKVKAPLPKPVPLSLNEQRRLYKRWTADSTDPIEGAVGLLALIYGLGFEEIAALRLSEVDLANQRLSMTTRPQPIILHQPVIVVVRRYLQLRDQLLTGSPCDYFFTTRFSYRYNRPVDQSTMFMLLKPANVNLRSLRATCVVETALTGHIKALEQLGLTIDGARPYLHIVQDSLAAKRLGGG